MTVKTEYVPGELSQAEKRATLENDRRVRAQGTTYSSFAEAFLDEERGGRFAVVNKTTHTATTPVYPEQPENSPFHHDPCGPEAPLGFSVDQMEPVGTPAEVEKSIQQLGEAGFPAGQPEGGADVAPASLHTSSADAVELAAPSTSNTDNSNDEPPEAA